MKKLVLLFLATVVLAASAHAAGYNAAKILLSDGSYGVVPLSKSFRVSFKQGYAVILGFDAKNPLQALQIPGEEFDGVMHDYDPTLGVEDATYNEGFVLDDAFYFYNLPAGSQISIVDLNGRVEFSTVAEGDFSLPFDNFTSGLHILNINGHSYKIHIK